MHMITIYRVNTGSCGGCDVEIEAAVTRSADLAWAETPGSADVLLLTGPLTSSSHPVFVALWSELERRVPLLAIGRCAIDGHPFGRGGVAELPELAAVTLDGCPPSPHAIAEAIRQAARGDKTIR